MVRNLRSGAACARVTFLLFLCAAGFAAAGGQPTLGGQARHFTQTLPKRDYRGRAWAATSGDPSSASNRSRLSPNDRRHVFEQVWKDIQRYYYDPAFNGVDWDEVHSRYLPMVDQTTDDEQFYALMSRMTGELHDAHTRFSSPARWRDFKNQQGSTLGFTVEEIDGKTVVAQLRANSAAEDAGIRPGMAIVSVQGEPIEERIAEIEKGMPASSSPRATRMLTYNHVFSGPVNSELKLRLRRADGSEFEAVLTRTPFSSVPRVDAHLLPSGNLYLRFDGFERPVTREFKETLERFHKVPGMMIDLRRNGGGDLGVLLPIAGYFFDKKTLFAKDSTRSGKPLSEFAGLFKLPLNLYVGHTGDQLYSGPVVILADAHSASSSEVFAAGMQDTHRAKVVGGPSCGCVLGIVKPRVMKGGGVLEMSEVLWFSPKGRKLEGAGIEPDQMVMPTVLDLQHGHDPVVEQADKALRAMAAAPQTAQAQVR